MKRYLIRNANIYPISKETDYLKMIYQSVFGVGHLIKDLDKAKNYLLFEMENLTYEKFESLYEYISDDFVRINLRPYKFLNLDIDELLNGMIDCANSNTGTYQDALCKIDILRDLVKTKVINININYIDEILKQYPNELPLFHHSEEYRQAYSPHYRVVKASFISDDLRLLNFRNFISSLSNGIVAIDGNCCTGKSFLTDKLDLTTIHIDDFFPENGKDRIQYDLALSAINSISHLTDFSYRAFDCTRREYYEITQPKASDVVLVEGVYSMDPLLGKYYNYGVLFKCPYDVRINRLRQRCSDYIFDKFINIWIPNEDKYFLENSLIENCYIII